MPVVYSKRRFSACLRRAWQADQRPRIGMARGLAAVFAALFCSLAINVCMSVFLPMPVNNRLALASILMIPIWVAIAFYCLFARNAWVAWLTPIMLGLLLLLVTGIGEYYG